ncbi:N-6 DNA methylase [Roseovarius sp.]|uniref:N-6 DNA methylase n=1 Tax=Roseobacteraceae TaxID=2854170 RepID=UPI0032EB4E80
MTAREIRTRRGQGEFFERGKRQDYLSVGHIEKITSTYQRRPMNIERYARCVGMVGIEASDFNLNISRCVSTPSAQPHRHDP